MTQTRARQRPEPAGEPAPTTIDPPPTPVEDVPEQATPAPKPDEDVSRALLPGARPYADEVPYLAGHEPDTIAAFRRMQLAAYERGEVGVGALIAAPPGFDRTPGDDLRDDHPLSAPEALAEVMRRVEPIAKGRTSDQGYKFRGIDDVFASLHNLFAEVGLVVLPRPVERIGEVRLVGAKQDRSQYVTHLLVEFRFLASDGTSETCSAWGEGSDMGDKATQKAHSQAMKSALLETFLIPTEDSARDEPDATNPEPGRAFTAEEQERAGTALDAAALCDTLDGLVAVGRRANAGGLLDVPVVGDAGRIAPLRFHLDARRVQLESQVRS
jgi:hypothetical protein